MKQLLIVLTAAGVTLPLVGSVAHEILTAPAATLVPAPAAPIALDDATIIAIFDAANTRDIETGQLGAERGYSAAVKEFGAMIARDHATVRQQGRDLAKKLNVTPTPPADTSSAAAHAKAMRDLRAKQGAAFDVAFAKHEVAYHTAVIEAINSTLLPAIKSPELRELVVKVAPAFEAHRLAAVALEKKVSGGQER